MIITRVVVRNFRSLREVAVNCHELIAILGRNGSGKSSFLKALAAFYDVSFQATPYDYFAKDTTLEISITVTYGELTADELTEFQPYLSHNQLTVVKVINSGGAKYYGIAGQLEEFFEYRKLSAIPKRSSLNALIESKKYEGLGPKVKTEAEADALMQKFEVEHPQLLKPFQREEQFFGPRNVGGGKLDKYTKFVLIPAVRDASAETERRGVILQLIDVLVTRTVNAREDVRKLNKEFEERVKAVYNAENLTELTELAGTITTLLSQYAPGAALDLSFGEVEPPAITLPAALASLVEDNFKTPIGYSGHGVQRALVLALLQQLSLTDVTKAQEAKEEEPEQAKLPDLILAIEEPELYLHPSRSRFLSSVLQKLAAKLSNLKEARTQVIFATHSPYFVHMDEFDRLRLARKVPTPGTDVLQCEICEFGKALATAKLAEIANKHPDMFTAESFAAHTVPVMTTTVNEGFFSDVAVVVEGLCETGVLWALQDILKKNWDRLGVVVVPAEGKSKIDRPVVIFRGLKIPTYFVFDADSKLKGKKNNDEASTITLNRLYCRLAGIPPQDFLSTEVNATWAVFEFDVETEIQNAIGAEYFMKQREVIAQDLGYTEPSKVLKNPEAAGRLIRSAYKDGKAIPVLEKIVAAITALRA